MGIADRFGNLFGRGSKDRGGQDKPSWWTRATSWLRRRGRPAPEPPPPPEEPDDTGIGGGPFETPDGDIGSVRIVIDGTFGSRSGSSIYAEWSGTIDTINGNKAPSSDNAENLAAALAAQDPRAVVDAINKILTLDYAGHEPGGRGGFTTYSPDEGIRVIAIHRIAITWT